MKHLRRALLASVFYLGAVTAADAGPLAAAIASVSGFIGSIGAAIGSTTIGSMLLRFVLGTAITLGLSLLSKASTPKISDKPIGIKTDVQVGGDNPLSFLLGHTATAGKLEYANTWGTVGGTPNAYCTLVYSLSDIPIIGLRNRIWVNGEECTIDTTDTSTPDLGFPVEEYNKNGRDHMWVKFYDGTQTAVDSYLFSKFSSDTERPWADTAIGLGIAYVIVTCLINRDLYTSIPTFLFECDGIKLYNYRLDSTNGGSGTVRWNDQSTWTSEGYDNPAVQRYNIIRGIYYGDQWIFGGQNLPAALLPINTWIAAANEDDLPIDLVEGGTERQFRSGTEVSCNIEPLQVLEEINKSCNGQIAEIGGFYKVHDGAPSAAVYSFTDGDIVITDTQELDPFPGLEKTYNGAHATYPEPAEAWQNKDAPPYYRTDLESLDSGRRLLIDLTYPTVPYNTQVQRLIQAAVEDNRRFRIHVLTLPPEAWLLEPLDSVSWTSTRNGYDNKLFTIVQITSRRGHNQIIMLKEIDPADHDWDPETDERTYSTGYVGGIVTPPQVLTGWNAQPATIYDSDSNARRPSIKVIFSGNQPDVQGVEIRVRLASSQEVIFSGIIPYGTDLTATKEVILNGTFLPDTAYEVQGKFIPYTARETTPSAWVAVTTDDIRLTTDDIILGAIGFPQLDSDVRGYQTWIGEDVRNIINQIMGQALTAGDHDIAGWANRQAIRRELDASITGVIAKYTEDIIAATGPGSSIVTAIESLNSVVFDPTTGVTATATALNALTTTVTTIGDAVDANSAAITSLENTIDDPVTGLAATVSAVSVLQTSLSTLEGVVDANAEAITAISAGSVDGDVATANFRMSVSAGPSGYASRIGLEARAGGTGTWRAASLFLDVPTNPADPSRVAVVADQFVVMNGTTPEQVFLVDGGQLYVNAAYIGNLVADSIVGGTLSSTNGKVFFDLDNGLLRVTS